MGDEGQVIGTGEASVRTDLMNFSFEDLAAAASQLEFPFKRLCLLDECARRARKNQAGPIIVHVLDNLPFDMVDTGKSRKNLTGHNSFSSSKGSSELGSWPRLHSEDSGGSDVKSKEKGTRKFLQFGRRGSKDKDKPTTGWDLFPGISEEDLPAGSFDGEEREADKLAIASPEKPAARERRKGFRRAASKRKDALMKAERQEKAAYQDDALARTFDVRDFVSAEQASSSRSEIANQGSHTPPKPMTSLPEAAEMAEMSRRPSGNSSLVKDTCRLRLHNYKGLVFINEYAIITTLGRGSFGEVKLALNTETLEVFALKLIAKSRKRSLGSPIAEASVMREINVMKELSHPNLVRLVEVIDDPSNNKILMVLEYVEGGSLFAGTRLSPKKHLSELQARKYFRDVLQGLSYLHENNFAHGDLKPENFLLATNGHIKIADFGSSQLTRVGDLVNRTAGTPAFMAPEMCGGQAYQGRTADLWALGVCLYMFVFGAVPFKATSIMGLYTEICEAQLNFPAGIFVSEALKHLIKGLLDKNPETRMSLATAMRHPWITYNGEWAFPSTSEEGEETLIGFEGMEGCLLESWPSDPEEGVIAAALRALMPAVATQTYADEEVAIHRGDQRLGVFKVEQGSAKVTRYEKAAADSDDDGDEECLEPDSLHQRQSMLRLMLYACIKASSHASASREKEGDLIKVTALRGKGTFVGDIAAMDVGINTELGGWVSEVTARGPLIGRFMTFKRFYALSAKYPEMEADGRAVMAQRKGELLVLGMLERLASFKAELETELASLEARS